MTFEKSTCTPDAPSNQETPQKELSFFESVQQKLTHFKESANKNFHETLVLYGYDQETPKTNAPEQDVENATNLQRRRFITALGVSAALAILPNKSKALDKIDPYWEKFQIAQKRLDTMGESSLKITDFLCDSALEKGTPGACFDVHNKRLSGPSDEPLIDVPRDQWHATPTQSTEKQTPTTNTDTTTTSEHATTESPEETQERMETERYKTTKEREVMRGPIKLTEQERTELKNQLDELVGRSSLKPKEVEKLKNRLTLTEKRLRQDGMADKFINLYSKKYGIPKDLITAIITMESNGERTALNLSSACAGYMGVSPIAARDVGRGVMDHLSRDKDTLKKLLNIIKNNADQSSLTPDEQTTLKTLDLMMQTGFNIASGTGYIARLFHEKQDLVGVLNNYSHYTNPRDYALPVIDIVREQRQ